MYRTQPSAPYPISAAFGSKYRQQITPIVCRPCGLRKHGERYGGVDQLFIRLRRPTPSRHQLGCPVLFPTDQSIGYRTPLLRIYVEWKPRRRKRPPVHPLSGSASRTLCGIERSLYTPVQPRSGRYVLPQQQRSVRKGTPGERFCHSCQCGCECRLPNSTELGNRGGHSIRTFADSQSPLTLSQRNNHCPLPRWALCQSPEPLGRIFLLILITDTP